ncbi:MAG: hypothetical protein HYV52_00615 [Parcubacteria group bacterium]|nr:hypothetical protein [Parcubacteria group bacterium]
MKQKQERKQLLAVQRISRTKDLFEKKWLDSNLIKNENKFGYTKDRGPYQLVCHEAYLEEGDARSRELYLKTR